MALRKMSHPVGPPQMSFPNGFIWGVGTSAYQIEGAWNKHGKGPSIWDVFCHSRTSPIVDHSHGDTACNSYELYDLDVAMLVELNVSHYRFSLSWPRLMPCGRPYDINEAGVDYYNRLIDSLVHNNIEPMVGTLEDAVKYWLTINEPWVTSWFAHGDGHFAPGIINQESWAPYLVTYHQLLAHARAYRCYDDEFRHKQNGLVSFSTNCCWPQPATNSLVDLAAAERAVQFEVGLFAHPVHSEEGGWPEVVEHMLHQKSMDEGLAASRLPDFSQEEIEMVRGTADYFGLNYYHMSLCSAAPPMSQPYIHMETGSVVSQRALDTDCLHHKPADWPRHGGEHSWVTHNPEGLRRVLNFIKHEYNNPLVLITENGCPSSKQEGLNDYNRIRYIHDHLIEVWRAIGDGCRVQGYMLWTLMDNFEWASGYSYKFGLYQVDFSDSKRRRMPRRSVRYVAETIEANRVLPVDRPRRSTWNKYTHSEVPELEANMREASEASSIVAASDDEDQQHSHT